MDVLSIVLGIGTAFGGGASVFMYGETRTKRAKDKRTEEIDTRIGTALGPVQTDLREVHTMLEADRAHMSTLVKAAMADALEPIKDQLSTLNTKVEPLWKSLEAAAIAAAQVLHQPDPARHMIDRLLEAFTEGTLSDSEETELRKYLVKIRNWEPGQDVGFPVHPGEPTAAAILLSTMDLAKIRKKQESKKT